MLKARDAHFEVAGRALVAAASLGVAPGEVVAIVGPNGAGKSTLVKLLAGELHLSGGAIDLNHAPLARWRPAERARMLAVLPQESRLGFAFTGLEVALFGRYPHRDGLTSRDDRAIALETLAMADATHLAERDFTTLSGGEKARVHLARVFAQVWAPREIDSRAQARYMLLDEPIAALDPAHQHMALTAVRRFAARSNDTLGVVAVLHDLNLAAHYCDRIVMMKEGRIVHDGAPRETLTAARIDAVFGLAVKVLDHPDTGGPLIAAAYRPEERLPA